MIFNPNRLMKKQMCNGILQNLVYGDCAKNVIYHMEKFNRNLVSQQPDIQTAAHIAVCGVHKLQTSPTER